MFKSRMLLGAMLLAGSLHAQVTDPMITRWWFNTTGNTYHGILTDVEAVYYNTTDVYVKTSGVPNYYVDGVTHNNASDLHATWQIPRIPSPSSSPAGIMGGQMGLMLDGSVFFHPGDAQSYLNAGIWNRLAYFFEGVDMDPSNGHSTPTNVYHHHFDNLKLHNWDATIHSPIVAYAWDGYPVYGPYGYANADGTGGIKRMETSYRTKSYTTRTSGPNVDATYPIGCFIEDWEYVSGLGDLDEHNGRFCKTPEYPDGTYAYFTTVDASLHPIYPYFIGPTFYGSFSNTNLGPTGGSVTVPGGATTYTPPTAVKDVANIEEGIKLYPIPVVTNLTIEPVKSQSYSVTLYDLNGKILVHTGFTGKYQLDMSNLSYGVYFVEVDNEAANSGFVKRIVK